MVEIPEKNILMMKTEVTQQLYETVMGENPSYHLGVENLPVECVSWYDAIYFCNKLSEKFGLTPVYSVNGTTDVKASGFRLPYTEEWKYAAEGGQSYEYSGSDNLNEVGWYNKNSGYETHPVAQKKANAYGLYDMSGNVEEWCWDFYPGSNGYSRYYCGGSYSSGDNYCKVGYKHSGYASYGDNTSADSWSRDLGFRIVCSASTSK